MSIPRNLSFLAENASSTGVLSITGGGTGTTTPSLVAGTNVSITGTWPNQTINSSNTGGTVTFVGGTGTVNGLTLTGTVTTSGNLTLGGTLDLSSPPAIGGTSAAAVSATTLTTSSTVTHNGGTANGVAYLNGSKVLTTGSAIQFDGTNLGLGAAAGYAVDIRSASSTALRVGSSGNAFGSLLSWDNTLGAGKLWTLGAYDFIFGTNSTEGMRLTSTSLYTASGINVGIGTSSNLASSKLDVRGRVRVGSGNSSGDAELIFSNYASATTAWDVSVRQDVGGANNDLKFLRFDSSGTYQGIAMQIDSAAGNVGIGTSSPSTKLDVRGGSIYNGNGTIITGLSYATTGIVGTFSNHALSIYTNSLEIARFDTSGNLLVGTTSSGGAGGMSVLPLGGGAGTAAIQIFNKTNTTSDSAILFRVAGTTVSGISYTSTVVTYGTVSDYRLKTVVGAISDSGTRIDALEPIEYTWNSNGQRTRGFLAHKFQEVYASSVTGTKDAVDSDGNPIHQGMQAGSTEVIADLVAEIQSLRKRLAALEST